MKKIKTIEEGVTAILNDLEKTVEKSWKYLPATGSDLVDTVIFDGEEIPLFWWRYDNQIFPLEKYEREIDSVSCKLNTVTTRSLGLDRLIIRQCDIAEWFLKSRVKKLNCYKNGGSAEILLTMQNNKVAILELAASLNVNMPEQGRLTVWGKKGMASNRVVSQKEMPQSIYVFTQEGNLETYNDLCSALYGLSRSEVIKVASIVDVLTGGVDCKEVRETFVRLKKYLELANLSAAENKPYIVKGGMK